MRNLFFSAIFFGGASLLVFYVSEFGVNVPINDDWDHVETSLLWIEKGISAGSLFALHNEHCLAIPRIWNHLILLGTDGNFKAVLLLNAGLAVLLLGCLIWFISTLRLPWLISVVASITVALAVSAWCQWQNLLWSFQAPFFMLPLFVFGSALLILRMRSDLTAFVLAIAISWLSIFTTGNGLFVAWVLAPVVLIRKSAAKVESARLWSYAYFANLFGVTGIALWLISNSSGKSYGSTADLVERPGQVVFAGLSVLGSVFAPDRVFKGENTLAFAFGSLSVCTALSFAVMFWMARKRVDFIALGPPLTLALYGSLSVAAVACGRIQLLIGSPIESRYQSFAIWWIVGSLLFGCSLLPRLHGQALAFGNALICATALALSFRTLYAMPLFYKHGQNMRTALAGHQEIYRNAMMPGGNEPVEKIASHYGADRLTQNLEVMGHAGILHPDLIKETADPKLETGQRTHQLR